MYIKSDLSVIIFLMYRPTTPVGNQPMLDKSVDLEDRMLHSH